MPQVDISWPSGAAVRERCWGWRSDITGQVVNADIDGLLTACLLHHLKGWPIIGFYDTQRLMLDADVPLPLDLTSTVWVDVDMCWPGARSLSQHVVCELPSDRARVSAYSMTVNPSLLRGHSRRGNYRDKYPFGTFQWAWWLAGAGSPPPVDDKVLTGLAWMPDGGFKSVQGVWRTNCLQWATEQMPGSILSPLATVDPDLAWEVVRVAEAELIRISGVSRGWHNHQFNLTRGSGNGPILNFTLDEVPDVVQSVCAAIASIYGWKAPIVPTRLRTLNGTWRTGSHPPRGWPDVANRYEVVSLAVTAGSRLCWTEPGELAAALPQP